MKILDSVLNYAIQKKASDIHIGEGRPVTYRIQKKLVTMKEAGDISSEKIKEILL
jgi:Tfp pilus assembly pilus retraction ATPase PilT